MTKVPEINDEQAGDSIPEVLLPKEVTTTERSKSGSNTKFMSKLKLNQETLPLKITLFLFFGAMSAILPYVTIHMQAIGISITEVAVIYAVIPFTSFIGPPMLGALADRIGNYKWVLILATFGNGLFHTLLLAVPSYQPPHMTSYAVAVKWDTVTSQGLLTPLDSKHCHNLPQFNNLTLTTCDIYHEDHTYKFLNSTSVFNDLNCAVEIPWDVKVFLDSYLLNGELLCQSSIQIPSPGHGNNQVTFWLYFFLRVVATMFMGSCFSLLDATTLAVVKRCGKAEYGKERIWSILGTATISPIAGVLVDQISSGKQMVDYSPAFYLSNALLVCSIVAFFLIELQVDKPEEGMLRNAVKLFNYPEVVVFLVMIFLLGNMWGFVESFLFIFLKELDAPNYLLGLTLTCGSLMGLPFLWGSEKIVAKFGRVNLIIAAFLTYFVRFFGYSYLKDPFWCFPFEAMEAFTYHLFWVAAATYCSMLAPKGMLASLMGIMGSLHYSLGKGAGSFFGGLTYGAAGARLAFRYFGVAAGILGIIFFLVHFFWIRKVIRKRQEEEEIENELGKSSKRGSIFDPNPIAGFGNVLHFDANKEDEENQEEASTKEKMLKPSHVLD